MKRLLLGLIVFASCSSYAMENADDDVPQDIFKKFEQIDKGEKKFGNGKLGIDQFIHTESGRLLLLQMRAIERLAAIGILNVSNGDRAHTHQTKNRLAAVSSFYFPMIVNCPYLDTTPYPQVNMLYALADSIVSTEIYFLTGAGNSTPGIQKRLINTNIYDLYLLYKMIALDGTIGITTKRCQDALDILEPATKVWPPYAVKGEVYSPSVWPPDQFKDQVYTPAAYAVIKKALELRKENKVDEKD